ncbi:MAG: Hint domain-containing protein [Candidatus Eremiobacteraeota bacterium]|nr:Hint domain-containing protein [Candidatus Eremiobacteraeota bacterium]
MSGNTIPELSGEKRGAGETVAAYEPKRHQEACFSGKTPVMTPQGIREIQFLREGDYVYTFDLKTRDITETRVEHLDVHLGEFEIREVRLSDHDTILATSNHKFYNGRCWVECREMSEIFTVSGDTLGVAVSEVFRKTNIVYNLRTAAGTYLVGHVAALVSGGTVLDLVTRKAA